MKVYGAQICVNCRQFKQIQKNRGLEVEYIDITSSTTNLKEFLQIRDTNPIFDEIKEKGAIGIPLFVNDNGQMTFEFNQALAWINQPPIKEDELTLQCDGSCSL